MDYPEVVDALSLEMLKIRLDGALNNLVLWKVSLSMAGPFQPKPFSDSTFAPLPIHAASLTFTPGCPKRSKGTTSAFKFYQNLWEFCTDGFQVYFQGKKLILISTLK